MRSSSSQALILLLGLVFASVSAARPRGRITIAPAAVVEGPRIRLADVASLEGEAAEALAGVVLGPAPAAGESRTLDGVAVLSGLRRAPGGLDGIVYRIPPLVRVRRASQELTEPAVRAIVEAFLAEAFESSATDVVLRSVELPGPLRIPTGSYTARIVPPSGAPLAGRVRLRLELTVGGRPVKTAWVTADIGVYAPVVVARRPVARGETLTAADVALEQRDLSTLPRALMGDLEEVIGQVARSPLVPAASIRREQLAAPAAVRRGDVVLLVAERGPLRVTVPGEVREDAALGERVRVVNRLSRKDLVGHVIDGRTVAVDF